MVDALVIDVGVEAFPYALGKDLSQIGTVVTKEGRDGLQLDIFLIMMIDVKEHIVEDRVFGGISQGSHDSFKLSR